MVHYSLSVCVYPIRRVCNRQLKRLVGQCPHVFEAVSIEYFACHNSPFNTFVSFHLHKIKFVTHRLRDRLQGVASGRVFPRLDACDVRLIQSRAIAEFILRQPLFASQFGDTCADTSSCLLFVHIYFFVNSEYSKPVPATLSRKSFFVFHVTCDACAPYDFTSFIEAAVRIEFEATVRTFLFKCLCHNQSFPQLCIASSQCSTRLHQFARRSFTFSSVRS